MVTSEEMQKAKDILSRVTEKFTQFMATGQTTGDESSSNKGQGALTEKRRLQMQDRVTNDNGAEKLMRFVEDANNDLSHLCNAD